MAIEMQDTDTRADSRTPAAVADLEAVRDRLTELDRELVDLIARRCALAAAAGSRKLQAGLPVVDPAREASVVRRGAERARAAGIDEERVRQIFWCLIDLSRNVQLDRDAAVQGETWPDAAPLAVGER